MIKRTLLTLTLLTGALSLTACAANEDMTTATNTPMPTVSATGFPDQLPSPTGVMPMIEEGVSDMTEGVTDMVDGMTGQPTASPDVTGVTSMDKARNAIESIEEELERLSEVEEAQVVIAGNRAAVALEFDDQYKGGIDDRLRDIVRERIAGVISGVDDIAITADAAILDALDTLGDRLETMSDMTALQNDLDAIIKRIKGA